MLELEDRIVDALRAIGDDAEPSAALDGLVRQRRARRLRRRRVAQVSTVAVAVIAVVAGAAGLGSLGTGGQASLVAGADGPPLFLVPAQVPDGFTLTHAAGDGRPGPDGGPDQDDGPDGTQRWVRMDGEGRPAEVVDVVWDDAGAAVDPLGSGASTPTTVRGHEGELSASGAVLAWTEAEGVTVSIVGTTAYPDDPGAGREALDLAVLTGFADSLIDRDGGGFDVSTPPAGFELAGEVPGNASSGQGPRTLVYSGPDGRRIMIDVVDGSDVAPAMNLVWTSARRLDVRGRTGVLAPDLMQAPALARLRTVPVTGLFLQWVEPTGELITVAGDGMTESELLDLAAGLEAVDAATWFALQDRGETAGETPGDTTGGPAATTADGPVAGEPVPGARQLSGTYSGTEHYALVGGDCGVRSILEAEFTLTDGAAWAYHADYCGQIDGSNDWVSQTGDGAFTLPDGSTLTVKMPFQRLPADTDGAPYELTVTAGTGTFAGATGTCRLDNHLTDLAFGTQQQDGSFVCDITP
jgi:hypothetical protein